MSNAVRRILTRRQQVALRLIDVKRVGSPRNPAPRRQTVGSAVNGAATHTDLGRPGRMFGGRSHGPCRAGAPARRTTAGERRLGVGMAWRLPVPHRVADHHDPARHRLGLHSLRGAAGMTRRVFPRIGENYGARPVSRRAVSANLREQVGPVAPPDRSDKAVGSSDHTGDDHQYRRRSRALGASVLRRGLLGGGQAELDQLPHRLGVSFDAVRELIVLDAPPEARRQRDGLSDYRIVGGFGHVAEHTPDTSSVQRCRNSFAPIPDGATVRLHQRCIKRPSGGCWKHPARPDLRQRRSP